MSMWCVLLVCKGGGGGGGAHAAPPPGIPPHVWAELHALAALVRVRVACVVWRVSCVVACHACRGVSCTHVRM
jgi:hypothetical protein